MKDRNEQELILVKMIANAVQIFHRFELIQHDRTAETVSEQTNALDPGKIFAILLREQQTKFMIHMPAENSTSEKKNKIDKNSGCCVVYW